MIFLIIYYINKQHNNNQNFKKVDLMKLLRKISFCFRTFTPEDYLFNMRDANLVTKVQTTVLKALPRANQGDQDLTDEIRLMGVPKSWKCNPQEQTDEFKRLQYQGTDLIFLQVDPSNYVARQRFLSHKCALGEVEDYRKDGVDLIDPHLPLTWEETVVNLFCLDMMVSNSLPKDTNYKNGLYTYSYPYYMPENKVKKQITPLFHDVIGEKILGGQRTDNALIDQILYTGLMGKQKIMLGGMPETLFKMILGQSLSISEMRDVFRTVILKNNELTTPFSTKLAAQNFMPHIFLLPKDLYMTALLKQSFEAAMQMVCAVNIEHWQPIQQYWVGPPYGVNKTDATQIPPGFPGETTEDLIQKQAIMDVLLQSRTWSKPYLSNPFPYLFEDITKIDKKELGNYKQIFLTQYKKYSEFKRREQKVLPAGEQILSLDDGKKRLEEVNKLSEDTKGGYALSHLKKKMSIKREEKWTVSSFFK